MLIERDVILAWIREIAKVIAENKEYLTQLDSAIGDADHGANMDRGFQKVIEKMPEYADKDIGGIFKAVGMQLLSSVGGASGPLYGSLFIQIGTKSAGKHALNLEDWSDALEAGVGSVMARGKAEPGDKTMVDALLPAVRALRDALDNQADLDQALKASAMAARQGMLSTIPLVARKGRASYLGERSAGHQDPGATSSFMILQALANLVINKSL